MLLRLGLPAAIVTNTYYPPLVTMRNVTTTVESLVGAPAMRLPRLAPTRLVSTGPIDAVQAMPMPVRHMMQHIVRYNFGIECSSMRGAEGDDR